MLVYILILIEIEIILELCSVHVSILSPGAKIGLSIL